MRLDDSNAVVSVIIAANDARTVVFLRECTDGTLLIVADLKDNTAVLSKMLQITVKNGAIISHAILAAIQRSARLHLYLDIERFYDSGGDVGRICGDN